MNAKAGPKSFKAAFEELEKIAAKFEGEEVDLEKGLPEFERGLELAQICKKKLGELDVRVKEIQEKFEV
ncbi:MAG: exodeoxyribonuclease VII small subunit [Gallionellaceae bacterium]